MSIDTETDLNLFDVPKSLEHLTTETGTYVTYLLWDRIVLDENEQLMKRLSIFSSRVRTYKKSWKNTKTHNK